VMLYTAGRGWIETLRIDTVNHLGPFRLNVWTSIVVFLLATAFFIAARRRSKAPEASQSFDDGSPGPQ
jgi:prolipoprotein diacylglyceryltransferase